MIRLLCILAIACWWSMGIDAQAQTFRGYIMGGGMANQIDGDALAGFNQLGVSAGVGVWYDLSDKWRTSLGFSYAQHGSKATARELQSPQKAYSKIKLNYVMVPVTVHYMDWLSEDEIYYRLEFFAGLDYRRLISSTTEDLSGVNIDDFTAYRNSGLGFSVGALYSLNEKTGLAFVHHRAFLSANVSSEALLISRQFSLQLRRAF